MTTTPKVSVRFSKWGAQDVGIVMREHLHRQGGNRERWVAKAGTDVYSRRTGAIPGAYASAQEAAEALLKHELPIIQQRKELERQNREYDKERRIERPCAACGLLGLKTTELIKHGDGYIRLCGGMFASKAVRECQLRVVAQRETEQAQ